MKEEIMNEIVRLGGCFNKQFEPEQLKAWAEVFIKNKVELPVFKRTIDNIVSYSGKNYIPSVPSIMNT